MLVLSGHTYTSRIRHVRIAPVTIASPSFVYVLWSYNRFERLIGFEKAGSREGKTKGKGRKRERRMKVDDGDGDDDGDEDGVDERGCGP